LANPNARSWKKPLYSQVSQSGGPGVERSLDGRVAGATLEVDVPELDPSALLLIEAMPSSRP
jgi:hypothetical protein